MRKVYVKPELEMSFFEDLDVITGSVENDVENDIENDIETLALDDDDNDNDLPDGTLGSTGTEVEEPLVEEPLVEEPLVEEPLVEEN